jgi:hypothetical protein
MKRRFVIVAALLAMSASADAQQAEPARASGETVAAVSMFSSWSQPALILDNVANVRLGSSTVAMVRPWIWRRQDGSWTTEWYQLQVRYQSSTALPWRVDAGIIPSPLGLATLEMRPDLNPTVSPPFYYFVPLPRFDTTYDGVQMMSGGYPFGAVVSTSGTRWDLRSGVTTATPSRTRAEMKSDQPPPMPQFVLGGGITPTPGLRIGAGFARGRYRKAHPAPLPAGAGYDSPGANIATPPSVAAASATVTNVEAEYAFGHTRLRGEWIWDRFQTSSSPVRATAFFAEGTQTLTPRLFAALRLTSVDAPLLAGTRYARTRATVGEAIAGYRLTRDFTLRGGYYTQRYFLAPAWDRELCVSMVWGHRWN